MQQTGRIANTSKNLIYGLLSQIITLILSFVGRIIFIKFLGETYLGVNGLFTNILSILSLAEMGFGTAITYALYKPLAENDNKKTKAFMDFFATTYKRIGFLVAIIGLAILPFLKLLIKDSVGIQNLYLIYLLFLADSVVSYFFAYKRSLLNADQKAYICSKYRFIFVFFRDLFQAVLIIFFKRFIIYLLIKILFTFLENLYISKVTNKIYPFLKDGTKYKINDQEKKSLKKDVGALMLSKIASVALHSTDNIIISSFVSIKSVGILSNYTLISGSLTMFLSQVSSAIIGSLGNFIASEKQGKHIEIFRKIDFMYYLMYGFCFVCMFTLYNPFISVFFGKQFVFKDAVVLVFCLNYLIEGFLQSFWNFRTTMGLFVQGKYRPLFAAIINIVFSLFLVQKIGVLGVLLGTTFSRVCVNLWYDPFIIFKHGLKRKPIKYFLMLLYKFASLMLIVVVLSAIKHFFFATEYTILSFVLLLIITVTIALAGIVLPLIKTNEFKYFLNLSNSFLKKIFKFTLKK